MAHEILFIHVAMLGVEYHHYGRQRGAKERNVKRAYVPTTRKQNCPVVQLPKYPRTSLSNMARQLSNYLTMTSKRKGNI